MKGGQPCRFSVHTHTHALSLFTPRFLPRAPPQSLQSLQSRPKAHRCRQERNMVSRQTRTLSISLALRRRAVFGRVLNLAVPHRACRNTRVTDSHPAHRLPPLTSCPMPHAPCPHVPCPCSCTHLHRCARVRQPPALHPSTARFGRPCACGSLHHCHAQLHARCTPVDYSCRTLTTATAQAKPLLFPPPKRQGRDD